MKFRLYSKNSPNLSTKSTIANCSYVAGFKAAPTEVGCSKNQKFQRKFPKIWRYFKSYFWWRNHTLNRSRLVWIFVFLFTKTFSFLGQKPTDIETACKTGQKVHKISENIPPNQRTARDFFIADNLREELQRKSAMTQQILPSKSPDYGVSNSNLGRFGIASSHRLLSLARTAWSQ